MTSWVTPSRVVGWLLLFVGLFAVWFTVFVNMWRMPVSVAAWSAFFVASVFVGVWFLRFMLQPLVGRFTSWALLALVSGLLSAAVAYFLPLCGVASCTAQQVGYWALSGVAFVFILAALGYPIVWAFAGARAGGRLWASASRVAKESVNDKPVSATKAVEQREPAPVKKDPASAAARVKKPERPSTGHKSRRADGTTRSVHHSRKPSGK